MPSLVRQSFRGRRVLFLKYSLRTGRLAKMLPCSTSLYFPHIPAKQALPSPRYRQRACDSELASFAQGHRTGQCWFSFTCSPTAAMFVQRGREWHPAGLCSVTTQRHPCVTPKVSKKCHSGSCSAIFTAILIVLIHGTEEAERGPRH